MFKLHNIYYLFFIFSLNIFFEAQFINILNIAVKCSTNFILTRINNNNLNNYLKFIIYFRTCSKKSACISMLAFGQYL